MQPLHNVRVVIVPEVTARDLSKIQRDFFLALAKIVVYLGCCIFYLLAFLDVLGLNSCSGVHQ